MKLYEPQPAILMYPYSGGWKVIRYVWRNVFSRTTDAATFWFDLSDDWEMKARYQDNVVLKYWSWAAFAGFKLAGAVQYVAALFIVAVFYFFQVIFLAIWSLLTSVLIVLLKAYNFLRSNIYKIYFRCPNCHKQMSIPIYICPGCATKHTRLWPSVYGVFRHRCAVCSTKLPTLDLLGRKKIIQRCAHDDCDYPLNEAVGRLVNVHVPIIGGPSVGKSNYLFMAINQFIDSFATPRKYMVEFPDEIHKNHYDSNLKLLSSGVTLLKTPDIVPHAYNLAIKKKKRNIGRIVYLYDAAGEAYQDESETMRQVYFKFIHGLIFVIDPFTIDLYYQKHKAEIEDIRTEVRPGDKNSVMGSYERMLTILESSIGLKRGAKLKQPIAIIVTKTDGLNLEEEIGLSAAQELMKSDSSINLVEDAIDVLVRDFLKTNGLGNFMRNVNNQFDNIKYFSCSSLGRLPDGDSNQSFQPVRVLEPLLWILCHTDVLKLREVRTKKIDQIDKDKARDMGNPFRAAKYYYWDSLRPSKKD